MISAEEIKALMAKDEKCNYATWGYKATITHKGVWGHRANTYEYVFSGSKGSYPDYLYRFTQCGVGSVHKERFADEVIFAKHFYEGYENALLIIDNISPPAPLQTLLNQAGLEVADIREQAAAKSRDELIGKLCKALEFLIYGCEELEKSNEIALPNNAIHIAKQALAEVKAQGYKTL